MTELHIMDELIEALTYNPEKTRRIPHNVSPEAPSTIRLMCSCRSAVSISDTVPGLEAVDLIRHTNRTGYVWVGKCIHCGLLIYTTKWMRGDT